MAALYWFTHDLRVEDNPLLAEAVKQNKALSCCFIVDPKWFIKSTPLDASMGEYRWTFLKEALYELADALRTKNLNLAIYYGDTTSVINELIEQLTVTNLVCASPVGYNEKTQLNTIKKHHPTINITTQWLYTLFDEPTVHQIGGITGSFSVFRRMIEKQNLTDKISPYNKAWKAQNNNNFIDFNKASYQFEQVIRRVEEKLLMSPSKQNIINNQPVIGGCSFADKHLKNYFSSGAASQYKQTRNDLHGLQRSTLFSPWLAHGCISPKQVWQAVSDYEANCEKNESTYWIKFELLWREYFQWLAIKQGSSLFHFKGMATASPNTSFYPQRYQKWIQGCTPYPLVNALMKQLNNTGFMSNRGRQIVASCLVNELEVDWRYGAIYFEEKLIDYDVASNWGNWQYIAGVGADPRGGRKFNINKQQEIYDPNSEFINRWQGEQYIEPLDSVNLVDWPISASHVD